VGWAQLLVNRLSSATARPPDVGEKLHEADELARSRTVLEEAVSLARDAHDGAAAGPLDWRQRVRMHRVRGWQTRSAVAWSPGAMTRASERHLQCQ
jgi:hypothetical protein